jgi:hypothetical protein
MSYRTVEKTGIIRRFPLYPLLLLPLQTAVREQLPKTIDGGKTYCHIGEKKYLTRL